MDSDFRDYNRGPGFWFLFELLVAADVSKRPLLSARLSDELPMTLQGDLYEVMDAGLTIYENINRRYTTMW